MKMCVPPSHPFSCKSNSFSFERLYTKTHFETEAKGNSEMVYWQSLLTMNYKKKNICCAGETTLTGLGAQTTQVGAGSSQYMHMYQWIIIITQTFSLKETIISDEDGQPFQEVSLLAPLNHPSYFPYQQNVQLQDSNTLNNLFNTYMYILNRHYACSIAVYFYKSCSIFASPKGESKITNDE